MSKKVYVKPPKCMRAMAIAQIVLGALFIPFGIMMAFGSEGEERPFFFLFALIWVVACGRCGGNGQEICSLCNGAGGKNWKFPCPKCGGSGTIER